jgi:hypothetical protein
MPNTLGEKIIKLNGIQMPLGSSQPPKLSQGRHRTSHLRNQGHQGHHGHQSYHSHQIKCITEVIKRISQASRPSMNLKSVMDITVIKAIHDFIVDITFIKAI